MSKYIGSTLVAGVGRNIERNAHTLLDFKWSDHIINSMEWLRADTFSWQPGSVYLAVYNHLVADATGTLQSETVGGITVQFYLASDGHKICPANQESNVASIYSATGVAWYYILDTANTRFKLPRTKFGFTGIRDTVGKYVEAGLPDHTHTVSTYNTGYTFGGGGYSGLQGTTNRTTSNASDSNPIYGNSNTVQSPATQMYLYFYVGQYTQSAIEQTAGVTTEQLNQKLDLDAGNATSSTKETVVGWGMPDYSAGVTKSANTIYTTTKDVFVIARNNGNYGNSTARLFIYSPAGTELINFSNSGWGGNGSNEYGSVCAFIPKGFKYEVTFTSGNNKTIVEYPLKGTN